jgi:hypothetical protein
MWTPEIVDVSSTTATSRCSRTAFRPTRSWYPSRRSRSSGSCRSTVGPRPNGRGLHGCPAAHSRHPKPQPRHLPNHQHRCNAARPEVVLPDDTCRARVDACPCRGADGGRNVPADQSRPVECKRRTPSRRVMFPPRVTGDTPAKHGAGTARASVLPSRRLPDRAHRSVPYASVPPAVCLLLRSLG